MMQLVEFTNRLIQVKNEESLLDFCREQLEEFGYDNVVISTYDRMEGPRILQAKLPEGWADTYFEHKFYTIDPAYKVQASQWEEHTWDSIMPSDCGKRVKDFIGIAGECGLKHGVTASAPLLARKLNFAISSSRNLNRTSAEQMLGPCHLMASVYASKLATFYGDGNGMDLSHRERELAHWLVSGLTNQQIADKMGITDKTVKEFIRRISIKNKLNGRVQIAVAAILNGEANL